MPIQRSRVRNTLRLCAAAWVVAWAAASADAAPIYGGPAFDWPTLSGYSPAGLTMFSAGDGVGAGTAQYFAPGSVSKGFRAVRWGPSGVFELGHLGTDGGGFTVSQAEAVNASGTAVGYAAKYDAGVDKGARALRWGAGGTAATELGHLGTNASGFTSSFAYAINASGTAVGTAAKYEAGVEKGGRAVRWDAGGTAATELGHLGTDVDGFTGAGASVVNASGTAAGQANKYVAGTWAGTRAVRWDAGGTAATELAHLGLGDNGLSISFALGVDASGTVVGWSTKHEAGVYMGDRAIRWDAGGTTATELGHLGTRDDGFTNSVAYAINASGTAVGRADRWESGGGGAVRWDAGGTAATELGHLGLSGAGTTGSSARSINSAGVAVGFTHAHDPLGQPLGKRAVMWGLDGVAFDLNALLSPEDAALWTLEDAFSISDSGWVTGDALYHAGGPGSLHTYHRMFLIQVPEPTTAGLLVLGGLLMLRRGRKR